VVRLDSQAAILKPEQTRGLTFSSAVDAHFLGQLGKQYSSVELTAASFKKLGSGALAALARAATAVDDAASASVADGCYLEQPLRVPDSKPMLERALAVAREGSTALSPAEQRARAAELTKILSLSKEDLVLMAEESEGFTGLPLFGTLPVLLGALHAVMNLLKTIYNKMLKIAWGQGSATLAKLARLINHYHVYCAKKARPGKQSKFQVEELLRVRGTQLRKLRAVFRELVRVLKPGPERDAMGVALELAHGVGEILHMGSITAQKHLYGAQSPQNVDSLAQVTLKSRPPSV